MVSAIRVLRPHSTVATSLLFATCQHVNGHVHACLQVLCKVSACSHLLDPGATSAVDCKTHSVMTIYLCSFVMHPGDALTRDAWIGCGQTPAELAADASHPYLAASGKSSASVGGCNFRPPALLAGGVVSPTLSTVYLVPASVCVQLHGKAEWCLCLQLQCLRDIHGQL